MARSRDTNGTGGGSSNPGIISSRGFFNKPSSAGSNPGILQSPGFFNKPSAPAKHYNTPVSPASSPSRNYSAPSGVSNTSNGTIAPIAAPAPPPAPVTPSVDDWLAGDATYKTQTDALSKAWKDYENSKTLQTNQYNTDYTGNTQKLGEAKIQAGTDLADDYASRGVVTSGMYGKAYTDYLKNYADRQKGLDTNKSDFLANLTNAEGIYKGSQDVTGAKAKQDAINRRASKYDLTS